MASSEQLDYVKSSTPVLPINNDSIQREEQLRQPVQMPVAKNAVYYNMAHIKRGHAYIFKHEHFQPNLKLNSLSGDSYDSSVLKADFENLGFDVEVYEDLTKKQLMETINRAAASSNHINTDCVIVVVLSYGLKGYLYANDHPYNPEDLWMPFTLNKCPSLAGKPKLFFIQACDAGEAALCKPLETETDNATSGYKYPVLSDFLIAYSTSPGLGFLKAVTKELVSNNDLDLLTSLSLPAVHGQEPCTLTHQLTRLVRFGKKERHLGSVTETRKEQPEWLKNYVKKAKLYISGLEHSIGELMDDGDKFMVKYVLRGLPEHWSRLLEKKNFQKYEELLDHLNELADMSEKKQYEENAHPGHKPFTLKKTTFTPDSPQTLQPFFGRNQNDDEIPEQSSPETSSLSSLSPSTHKEIIHINNEDFSDDSTSEDPYFCNIKTHHRYRYDMRHGSAGVMVLIANKTFQVPGWPALQDRECFDMDIALSRECFINLGFEVRELFNKKKEEILSYLNDLSNENHAERNSLVILVSTHGEQRDCIFASDDMYNLYDLLKPFTAANCKTLEGKPKLFFIGPCRGSLAQESFPDNLMGPDDIECNEDGNKKKKEKNPVIFPHFPWPDIESDFLILFSTVPEYVAFQSAEGSLFVKSICQRLRKKSQRDINHIVTFIHHKIATLDIDGKFHGKKQMSQVTSKLSKFLIFPDPLRSNDDQLHLNTFQSKLTPSARRSKRAPGIDGQPSE